MGRKKLPKVSRKTMRLLRNYVTAFDRDSWKGGGDPADWKQIEEDLLQCETDLLIHLSQLESLAKSANPK